VIGQRYADTLAALGQIDEADGVFRELLSGVRDLRPEDDAAAGRMAMAYGRFLAAQHRRAEARALLEEAVQRLERAWGPEDSRTLGARRLLEEVSADQGS